MLFALSPRAGAQLDSSSAVLLRSSGRPVSPQDLDSSLYTIRVPESKSVEEEDLDSKPGKAIASPVTPKVIQAPPPAPLVATPAPPVASSATPPPTPEPAPPQTTPEPPPVTTQVRELILGGSFEDIEEYRKQMHPDDSRKNMLEMSFAPAFFYDGSESSYSFRRYTSRGPGFGAGMNLWLTPFFGIHSKYFSSVTGALEEGAQGASPLDLQVIEAGVRFRRHFGFSKRAPQLAWGIDYQDKSEKISRDSISHIGNRSFGFGLALEATVPSSSAYAHTFAIDVQPRLSHSERATGVSTKSGTSNQANALRLSLGGQWSLDRRNLLFWKSQYRFERDLFQGTATATDPKSGLSPSDVSVSQSLMMFYLGFKWGS